MQFLGHFGAIFGAIFGVIFGAFLGYILAGLAVWTMDRVLFKPSLRQLHDHIELLPSYRSWYSATPSLVHATRVGLLHPRTGGLPLKLRYFLPPADLLASGKAAASSDLTEAVLLQRDLGLTVTLTMEKSESRSCLMPTKSLVTNLVCIH